MSTFWWCCYPRKAKSTATGMESAVGTELMTVFERHRDLGHHRLELFDAEGLALLLAQLEDLPEGQALEELHGEERMLPFHLRVEDPHQIGAMPAGRSVATCSRIPRCRPMCRNGFASPASIA